MSHRTVVVADGLLLLTDVETVHTHTHTHMFWNFISLNNRIYLPLASSHMCSSVHHPVHHKPSLGRTVQLRGGLDSARRKGRWKQSFFQVYLLYPSSSSLLLFIHLSALSGFVSLHIMRFPLNRFRIWATLTPSSPSQCKKKMLRNSTDTHAQHSMCCQHTRALGLLSSF